MGLIDKQTALQVFDNTIAVNGLGLEPLIALRDVKEIIKALPEADAVPLDKLAKWMAERYAVPCRAFDEPDEIFCGSCYKEGISDVECWKRYFTEWMEEQNAR